MKIAVIGCTHAGTAAIKNAVALYPDADIHVFERNDTVSFLSCGIALYVGGVVEDVNDLFYASVEGFRKQGIHMHMKHDVVGINIENKVISAKNLTTSEVSDYDYDKLIITTGSWPITPPFPGLDLENVVLCKNFYHAKEIIERAKNINKVTVVGAGYIGVELVEAFEENGKEVTLIDAESRILNRYFDKPYTDPVEETLREKGVSIRLNELVSSFVGDQKVERVVTNKGEVDTELVVLCIGFSPNTSIFKGQLEMLPNGAILIDEYMHTSHPDVLAAGDCCAVPYNPTKQAQYIPLATNAVRMGTLVAHNLVSKKLKHPGTQGTSGLKIYNHNLGSSGLTEDAARAQNLDVGVAYLEDSYRPEFMPSNSIIKMTLIYDLKTHRVLGTQVISDTDLTQVVNTASVAISRDMTIEELALTDFFFQPHFNKPVNYLNQLALNAMANEA